MAPIGQEGIVTDGSHLIGGSWERGEGAPFRSINPSDGTPFGPTYHEASSAQMERAVSNAASLSSPYGFVPPDVRAEILSRLASSLDEAEAAVVEVACKETALSGDRLQGELGRTTAQLRSFSNYLGSDDQQESIDDPEVPLARRSVAIGPVAVFEASNFPLAFATLGGDTASAIAAGNPVVVKAHPSHPQTSEFVSRLAAEVFAQFDLASAFSVLHGQSTELGKQLVCAPRVAAVGFTGSTSGGRALMDLAASRDVPIPVHAEMGSVNGVVVTERAANVRAEEIASGFVESMLMGGGQFCTKPGLLVAPENEGGEQLISTITDRLSSASDQILLNESIAARFASGASGLASQGEALVRHTPGEGGFRAGVTFVRIDPPLPKLDEVFGPAAVATTYKDDNALALILESLAGSLAMAIHCEENDPAAPGIIEMALGKTGRLIINGYPTGVAVSPAMMHGGPYPASSNWRFTSVGLDAMNRFLRPVSIQGVAPPGIKL